MTKNLASFSSEAEMVNHCRQLIHKTITNLNLDLSTQYEVLAPGSKPDLVIFDKKSDSLRYVITVEFKIRNWRRAIQQAFRHRNFGNEAYVVLDCSKSRVALHNLNLFKRANVGLITVAPDENIRVWYYPEPSLPFSAEYSRKVARLLLSPREPASEDLTFIENVRESVDLLKFKHFWNPSSNLLVA